LDNTGLKLQEQEIELNKLGIVTRQPNGEFRYFCDIFSDVVDMLKAMEKKLSKKEYAIQVEYISSLLMGKLRKNYVLKALDGCDNPIILATFFTKMMR
jgi:hypothetical protein